MHNNASGFWRYYLRMLLISLCCIPIGAIIGCVALAFGKLLLFVTAIRLEHVNLLIPFLALGGVLIKWAYMNYGNGNKIGMVLVFDAAQGETDLVPARLIPMVTGATCISHLFGGSIGREGVAVQIGGFISYLIGKKLPIKNAARIFMIAGMAAGFAGLFHTPIAAVFFALEVLTAGVIMYEALLPALVASYTASMVSSALGLTEAPIVLTDTVALSLPVIGKLVLLGFIFGLVGALFAILLKRLEHCFAVPCKHPLLRVFLGGAVLSVFFLVLHHGRYSGFGTNLIEACFENETIYAYDWIFKLLLTAATVAVGFRGGEVTPLFSIGASLGILLGGFIGLPLEFTAALGYVAVFASASNTLITPILIGGEVFGFQYVPYFFIVCAVAYCFNLNQSIYLKQQFHDPLQLDD